jgi:plasmid maintenance system killer protein
VSCILGGTKPVNEKYRVIFKFANGTAEQVRITDYH